MKLPDLADLPYAGALIPHDGDLSSESDFDTVLFEHADYDEPRAPDVRFLECALRQVSIAGGTLSRARLHTVWARDLRLTGTSMAESNWRDVTVLSSSLAGVQAHGAVLRQVVFSGCKLDSVNFRFAKLTSVIFDHCVLRDVDFLGAELTRCSFPGSQLSRVDLSKVTMDQTDLRGAELGLVIDVDSLRGAIISSGQLAMAAPVLAEALGIVVNDVQP
jgi:uncharacterized protein YjbI with pentapeptide repeats